MEPKSRPPRRSPFVLCCISRLLVMVALVVASAGSSSAEIFFVVNTDDAIPPTPGSLRAAIQQSESNGEPDIVQFLIDGGSIVLVSPLPDLNDGRLSLGFPRVNTQPSAGNGVTISGINGVPHAIRLRSPHNIIAFYR